MFKVLRWLYTYGNTSASNSKMHVFKTTYREYSKMIEIRVIFVWRKSNVIKLVKLGKCFYYLSFMIEFIVTLTDTARVFVGELIVTYLPYLIGFVTKPLFTYAST